MFLPLQSDNVGGLSEATVRAAYENLSRSNVVVSLIGIVTVLAIIFMVHEAYKVYENNNKKGTFDRKGFFELLKLYGKYAIFIGVFPFIIYGLETALAEVQDNITSQLNSSLEKAGTQAIVEFVEKYIEEEFSPPEDAGWFRKGLYYVNKSINPIEWVKAVWQRLGIALYMISIYILKYIYFFFCMGRYTWLLMLQVVAPVAVICAINKETRHYFYSWVKNMIICYLLIPFFLMADALGESVIEVVTQNTMMSVYGVFGVIGMVFIKIGLFSYVSKKAYSLM